VSSIPRTMMWWRVSGASRRGWRGMRESVAYLARIANVPEF